MAIRRRVTGDTAAMIRTSKQVGGTSVHANAGSNAAAGTIPAYADFIYAFSTVPFRLAVGETTSGTVGIPLAPNIEHRFMIERSGGTLNTQTIGVAGTIYYGYTEGL